MSAHWGNNQSDNIYNRGYSGSGNWNGVSNFTVPSSGEWVPDDTCAYQFRLSATARTTNGYHYIGHTEHTEHLTIIKPGGRRTITTKANALMPLGHDDLEMESKTE